MHRERLFGKFGAKEVQAEAPVTQHLRNYSEQAMVSRLMPRMLEGEVLKKIYADILAKEWRPLYKPRNMSTVRHV